MNDLDEGNEGMGREETKLLSDHSIPPIIAIGGGGVIWFFGLFLFSKAFKYSNPTASEGLGYLAWSGYFFIAALFFLVSGIVEFIKDGAGGEAPLPSAGAFLGALVLGTFPAIFLSTGIGVVMGEIELDMESSGGGGETGESAPPEVVSGIINLNEWVNDDDRSYEGLAGVPRGDGYEDVMKWDMPAGDSGSTWGYIEYTCRQGSTQKVDVGLSTRSEDAVDSETWRFPCDGEDHAFGVQVHPGGDLDVYTEW